MFKQLISETFVQKLTKARNNVLISLFFIQVSTQCRYPLEPNGKTLFCVYLYRLSSTSSDSDDWRPYTENGNPKVISRLSKMSKFAKNFGSLKFTHE